MILIITYECKKKYFSTSKESNYFFNYKAHLDLSNVYIILPVAQEVSDVSTLWAEVEMQVHFNAR